MRLIYDHNNMPFRGSVLVFPKIQVDYVIDEDNRNFPMTESSHSAKDRYFLFVAIGNNVGKYTDTFYYGEEIKRYTYEAYQLQTLKYL